MRIIQIITLIQPIQFIGIMRIMIQVFLVSSGCLQQFPTSLLRLSSKHCLSMVRRRQTCIDTAAARAVRAVGSCLPRPASSTNSTVTVVTAIAAVAAVIAGPTTTTIARITEITVITAVLRSR